jgi:hypothetical protein
MRRIQRESIAAWISLQIGRRAGLAHAAFAEHSVGIVRLSCVGAED